MCVQTTLVSWSLGLNITVMVVTMVMMMMMMMMTTMMMMMMMMLTIMMTIAGLSGLFWVKVSSLSAGVDSD